MRKLNVEILKQNITSRAEKQLNENRFSGASAAVYQNGERVFKGCFGDADDGTLYRIASMTKPITAAAVLKAFEERNISLDTKITEFLPDFKNPIIGEKRGDKIVPAGKADSIPTVRSLLSHSSGIGCGEIGWMQTDNFPFGKFTSLKDLVDAESHILLSFEPFSDAYYSPIASFDIAARIIEIVTGEEFGKWLNDNIFKPLAMKDTTFTPTAPQWKRVAKMHVYGKEKGLVDPMKNDCVYDGVPAVCHCAGAGLISSLADYAGFALMLLNGGLRGGKRILTERTINEMATPQPPLAGREIPEYWGLGVRVTSKYNNYLPEGCFGWSGAYGTHFWVDKADKIVAVYMKNSRFDGGSEASTARDFETDVMNSFNK